LTRQPVVERLLEAQQIEREARRSAQEARTLSRETVKLAQEAAANTSASNRK
jgi:hypothetical protein